MLSGDVNPGGLYTERRDEMSTLIGKSLDQQGYLQ